MRYSLGIASAVFASAVLGQKAAHNYPGSESFPNNVAWNTLRDSVGGRLTDGKISSSSSTSKPSVAYTVSPENAKEAELAVQFAAKHNLRVSIKGTGHDFMSRNTGAGSLLINTKGIRNLTFITEWNPSAGSTAWKTDQSAKKQAAVVIGAGMTWAEVLKVLEVEYKYTTVHGASSTVGASGGWVMGGGHGPLSNVYGMGCDNVLEMTVVLANGTTVVVNENSYPDLFFALRGGGGGTFGVVTQTTMKAYPLPTMHGIRITIYPSQDEETFLSAVAYLLSMTSKMTDFGISGYPDLSSKRFSARFRAPDKTPAEIETFMEPILQHMETIGTNFTSSMVGNTGSTLFLKIEKQEYEAPYKRYYAAERLAARQARQYSPSPRAGMMLSRLLSRKALVETNQPAIRSMLKTVLGSGAIILPYPVAGGQVERNRNLDVGLNPAWRDAVMHLIVMTAGSTSSLKAIDSLSANSGAYLNEGLAAEVDWKKTFFGGGEHYARLLRVKEKYDPTNRFWCKPCVGSDLLSEGPLGYLQLRS